MARNFVRASSQYLDIATPAVSGYPLTLAAWVRSTDTGNSQDVLVVSDASIGITNQLRLNLGGNAAGDPVRAVVNDSGGAIVLAASSSGYSSGVWFHACAVFATGNDRRAFVNGGSKGTNTSGAGLGTLTRMNIGRVDSGNYLQGDAAEAAIWNVALSDQEIAALARGVSPLRIRPESLAAYWPLWGLDTTEPDLSPGIVTASRYDLTNHSTTKANHAPVAPFSRMATYPVIEAAGGGGGTVPIFVHHRKQQRAA